MNGGLMPGRRVVPEQKLDYHINFTLQNSIGNRFADICEEENVTIKEKLRFLVQEYVEWKDDIQKANAT
jgi:hypothetical protein